MDTEEEGREENMEGRRDMMCKSSMGSKAGKNGEKKGEMRERKQEGETVTLGLPHLRAYHLACRGKITVPVPHGPE